MSSSRGRRLFERCNVVMALLFLVSAGLQLNDPDPLPWVLLYGAAALACLVAGRVRGLGPLPMVVALVTLVWATGLGIRAWSYLEPARLFEPMREKTPAIEEGRELFGLLIVAAWMLVVTAVRARDRRGRAAAA